MNYAKQGSVYKEEICPKCGKKVIIKSIGNYGTDNMKYKCGNCHAIILDEKTRGELQLRASWK